MNFMLIVYINFYYFYYSFTYLKISLDYIFIKPNTL